MYYTNQGEPLMHLSFFDRINLFAVLSISALCSSYAMENPKSDQEIIHEFCKKLNAGNPGSNINENFVLRFYKMEDSVYLDYKRLTTIPTAVGNLMKLKRLYLQNNQLTILPLSIINLIEINTLWLNNNKLTNLLPDIGNLFALETLYLDNNQLETLPTPVGNLVKLKCLNLSGNPLKGDEVQWARHLHGDELKEFRFFYTKKDVLIKGCLLLMGQESINSVFAELPRELIDYIINIQIHKYLDRS